MAQLRDIRRRIKSVQKTQQVTRAMKMVAAAKLQRAQQAILEARPYAENLKNMISHILSDDDLPSHPLLEKKSGKHLHLLVLTGEKGLCGGFNVNIFKEVESICTRYSGPLDITVVGKKGIEFFTRRKRKIISSYLNDEIDNKLYFAELLAEKLIRSFTQDQCDKLVITYTEFQSAMTQRVVSEWLLPLEFEDSADNEVNLDYIFHPNPGEILNTLLPRYLKSQIFRAILESQASEFGARMTAMDSATRNSEEMIDRLTLQYNRARQAAITTELIEIVSGAEALKN